MVIEILTSFTRAGVACVVKTAYIPFIGTWADFTYNIGDVLIWAITESAITIIAASIPFMLRMMQDFSSRGGSRSRVQSYGNAGSIHLIDQPGGGRNLGTRTDVNAQPSIYGIDAVHIKDDDESDRSILRETNDNGRITQTHEVTIAYSESGDEVGHDDRVGKLY